MSGRLVTGLNGNSIFLPAAGCRDRKDNAYLLNVGSYGYYWSSSLNTGSPYFAWLVIFFSGDVYRYTYFFRCKGLSVRAVSE